MEVIIGLLIAIILWLIFFLNEKHKSERNTVEHLSKRIEEAENKAELFKEIALKVKNKGGNKE